MTSPLYSTSRCLHALPFFITWWRWHLKPWDLVVPCSLNMNSFYILLTKKMRMEEVKNWKMMQEMTMTDYGTKNILSNTRVFYWFQADPYSDIWLSTDPYPRGESDIRYGVDLSTYFYITRSPPQRTYLVLYYADVFEISWKSVTEFRIKLHRLQLPSRTYLRWRFFCKLWFVPLLKL